MIKKLAVFIMLAFISSSVFASVPGNMQLKKLIIGKWKTVTYGHYIKPDQITGRIDITKIADSETKKCENITEYREDGTYTTISTFEPLEDSKDPLSLWSQTKEGDWNVEGDVVTMYINTTDLEGLQPATSNVIKILEINDKYMKYIYAPCSGHSKTDAEIYNATRIK